MPRAIWTRASGRLRPARKPERDCGRKADVSEGEHNVALAMAHLVIGGNFAGPRQPWSGRRIGGFSSWLMYSKQIRSLRRSQCRRPSVRRARSTPSSLSHGTPLDCRRLADIHNPFGGSRDVEMDAMSGLTQHPRAPRRAWTPAMSGALAPRLSLSGETQPPVMSLLLG